MKILYYSPTIASKKKESDEFENYTEYYSQCIASPQDQGRNSFSIPCGKKTRVAIIPFSGKYNFEDAESYDNEEV